MRDREMVAAIAAGEPEGLAAAYDHYAPALHSYCRSLLTEPMDAADAVQDTFVVAVAKLGGLRDSDRLRPWLYAVARNECRRHLRNRSSPIAWDEAEELTDDTADFGAALQQAELREIVRGALAGLSAGEREVIELSLRHEFYGADLADALGVPLNQAHALAARARAHFETSLGALLAARSGQQSCPELAAELDGWDGQLTVLLRKRIRRHIEHCDVCGERRRRDLSPVALLSILPATVLPAGLRDQVLGLVADGRPDAVGYRAEVAQQAEPFARSGFPVPIDPLRPVRGPGTFAPAAGAAVAALAVLGGGVMFTADVVHHGGSGTAVAAAPGQPALPSATPAPSAGPPSPLRKAHHRSTRDAQVGVGPTFGVTPTPSGTKKKAKASPTPTHSKKKTSPPSSPPPSSPPPSSPPPSSPPPSSPPPTTPPPTTPAAASGASPASVPLLAGASAVLGSTLYSLLG